MSAFPKLRVYPRIRSEIDLSLGGVHLLGILVSGAVDTRRPDRNH
jgi:hypothetical protein